MAQALSTAQAKVELQRAHDICCGDNDISIYKTLHRQGYYWLEMAKEVIELQLVCWQCQEPLNTWEPLFIEEDGDRRQPYMDFFQHNLCQQIALMR